MLGEQAAITEGVRRMLEWLTMPAAGLVVAGILAGAAVFLIVVVAVVLTACSVWMSSERGDRALAGVRELRLLLSALRGGARTGASTGQLVQTEAHDTEAGS
jgi:hypothetical protein